MGQELKHENLNIVFFDGLCNFCHGSVKFIYPRDKKHSLYYASLQSDLAKKIIPDHCNSEKPDSIVLWEKGVVNKGSTAALRISKNMSFPWNLLSIFLLLPAFLRDPLYYWVAKNRYRWFGKKESCTIPDGMMQQYFLD